MKGRSVINRLNDDNDNNENSDKIIIMRSELEVKRELKRRK